MVMKRTNAYWQKRATQRFLKAEKNSRKNRVAIRRAYNKAQRILEQDLKKIYAAYYKKEGWDLQALNSIAPQGDVRRFMAEMKKLGLSQELPDNYLARATRLELLNNQIALKCKELAIEENQIGHQALANSFNESYYQAGYDIAKGIGGKVTAFSSLDEMTVTEVFSRHWQGGNYATRIWANTDSLAQKIQGILASGIATGASVDKMSREVRQSFDVSKYYADRLIRTELNYVHGQAEMAAYKEMGVEEYKLVATLDHRTSAICQYMDGQIFKTKDAKVGVNLNPFHPLCRTTSVPYLGKEFEPPERIARDPVTGKNYYISNMSYDEWREQLKLQYAPSGINIDEILVKGWRTQYDAYKGALGKEMISYDRFVSIRMNGGTEKQKLWWKDAKSYMRQYREGNLSDKWTFKQWRYDQNGVENPKWRAVDFNPKLFYKDHYEKHVQNVIDSPKESMGDLSPEQYIRRARNLLNDTASNKVLKSVTNDGELMAYDVENDYFAIARKNGIIKTYFKPTSKIKYWKGQVEKYGKKTL